MAIHTREDTVHSGLTPVPWQYRYETLPLVPWVNHFDDANLYANVTLQSAADFYLHLRFQNIQVLLSSSTLC